MNAETKIEGTFTDPDLVLVPVEHIPKVLSLVLPWVQGVAKRSGGALTEQGIIAAWLSGKWQMWLINADKIKAVMATELHIQNSGRKACSVHFMTGEDSMEWVHLTGKLEEWATFQGCEVLDMIARKGWAKRLPDYRMTHVFLEKELI